MAFYVAFGWVAVSVSLVATAIFLTLIAQTLFDVPTAFFFFSSVIVISTFQHGLKAGLTTTLFSMITIPFFVLQPRFSFVVYESSDLLLLVIFVGEGLVLSVLTAKLNHFARQTSRSFWIRYGCSIAVLFIAFLLKNELVPYLRHNLPFTLFYAAVMISAWIGGTGPGLFATVSSTCLSAIFFYQPIYSFRLSNPEDIIRLVVFVIEGVLITLISTTIFESRRLAQERSIELEQRQLEIQRSELRYRTLLEGIQDHAVFLIDQMGRILTWPRCAEQVFGYRSSKILGESIRSLSNEQAIQDLFPESSVRFASGQNRYVYSGWFLKENQDRFRGALHLAPVGIQANQTDYSVVIYDYTEIYQAEEDLRNREIRLRRQNEMFLKLARLQDKELTSQQLAIQPITEAVTQSLGCDRVGVWLFDENQTELTCVDLFQFSTQQHSHGIKLTSEEYPKYFRALQDHRTIPAHDAKNDPRTTEFSQSYLLPLNIASMLDAPIYRNGKFIGVVCHEHVGTARVWELDEQQFAGAVADLIALKLESFDRYQVEQQLQRAQRLESLGAIVGGVAHDLNNLLTPIMMSVELLKFPIGPEEQTSLLETIQTSVEGGASLVRQILSFARGSNSKIILLDLGKLIQEVQKLLERTFPKSIQIQSKVGSDLWYILGNATEINQVLMNLCVNARDAMPNGGTLIIQADNVTIPVNDPRFDPPIQQGRYVLLRVQDTGTGIPEAIRQKIFDAFFTTKEPGKGTGLGLATTLSIINKMNGRLRLESEEGIGTEFQIYLRASQSFEVQPEKLIQELPLGKGERILVIDDEASVREMIQRTLETYGYHVDTVDRGTKGLQLYQQQPDIQLVVVNIMLPELSGEETIQIFRSSNPLLPIIAMTGFLGSDDPNAKIPSGANALLAKPFTTQQLLVLIRELLTSNLNS